MRPRRAPRGFSMVELLVAVLVLSIALVAAFRAFGSGTDMAAAVRDRTLAGIVAANHAAALQLGEASPDGAVDMAGRRWEVTSLRRATRAGFEAVTLRVAPGAALTVWRDPAAAP